MSLFARRKPFESFSKRLRTESFVSNDLKFVVYKQYPIDLTQSGKLLAEAGDQEIIYLQCYFYCIDLINSAKQINNKNPILAAVNDKQTKLIYC